MDSSQLITSSINLLAAHASQKTLFSPLPISDTQFYDDGPIQLTNKTVVTSSISGSLNNLSSSYPWVQGVEITKQAQYDAGVVKIWSGDPQHQLKPCVFGQDRNFDLKPTFVDADLFNPIEWIKAQDESSPLWDKIFTFPIITGDNDQIENYNFNGIIEPLTIRPLVAFYSIDAPLEAHSVKGTVMDGNVNQIGGSERIYTVDYFQPTQQITGYLDIIDIIEGHPLNGYFEHDFSALLPFVDQRLLRNTVDTAPMSSDMIIALNSMTGSTDNYVCYNQRSATCGWYYDNNASVGTDSLVYGGMTY